MGEPSCGVSQSGWPTTTLRRSRSTPSRRYSRKAAAVLTSMRVAGGLRSSHRNRSRFTAICRARSPASAEPRLPLSRVYRTNSCDSARYSSVWGASEANQSASLPSSRALFSPAGGVQLRPLHRIDFAADLFRVRVARGKRRGIAQRRFRQRGFPLVAVFRDLTFQEQVAVQSVGAGAVEDLYQLLLRTAVPGRLPLPRLVEGADVTARFGAKRLRVDLVAEQVPAG